MNTENYSIGPVIPWWLFPAFLLCILGLAIFARAADEDQKAFQKAPFYKKFLFSLICGPFAFIIYMVICFCLKIGQLTDYLSEKASNLFKESAKSADREKRAEKLARSLKL